MKKLIAISLAVFLTAAAAMAPSMGVHADEVDMQADAAALAATQSAGTAARAAAEAIDLRTLIGQSPSVTAASFGTFTAFPNMIEGSYYTNGAIEFWGTEEAGIRSVQFLSSTTANIAGVTFGMNYDAAKTLLQSSGWSAKRSGGRRAAFWDPQGNLLSVAYDTDGNIFWVNYLKIY